MGIKAVLVDDERPALRMMEILLSKYPQIEIVGEFTNPVKAIEEMNQLQPDLIFLDIDMPHMNGMDTAAHLLELCPHTMIVFVTAYQKYALEAYQFHPMDYILKPVDEERLNKLIQYVSQKLNRNYDLYDKKLLIRCFGDFYIKWEDKEPIKWRTEKTKELFAYLVDNYDSNRTKEEILDNLWPDEYPDKAMKQLYNGIYYIRKALSEYGVSNDQIMIDNTYHLMIKNVDFDVEKLKLLKKDSNSNLEAIAKASDRQYFEKLDYPWADMKREEYFLMHQKSIIRLAEEYQKNMEYGKEEYLLQKVVQDDPLNETAAEMLMNLYLLTKNKIKGIKFFQVYEKTMKEELKEKPSRKILEYYNMLKAI